MKCPNDETVLVMSDRQGIEIDYCPQCRGVWLDRGELDKILDRSASIAPTSMPSQPASQQHYEPPRDQHHYDNQHHDSRNNQHYRKKRKKEGFLGEIFDF